MTKDNSLRSTFNESAHDYNAVRPGYPDQLFEDVITLSGIPPGGQALEIGCGTGQATLPFARRGFHILCLDIGADLLAIAAKNLQAYPGVHFKNVSFEDWPVKSGEYDLVYAATSFHWIPPEIGYPKAAQALKPGGALAIFANTHPRPYSGFFEEVQSVYRQYMPEPLNPDKRPVNAGEAEEQAEYMRSTGLFRSVEVRNYPWTKIYPTGAYIQLLNTYSDHLALPDEQRHKLYQGIASLIDSHYGGKVERPYLTRLFVGKT